MHWNGTTGKAATERSAGDTIPNQYLDREGKCFTDRDERGSRLLKNSTDQSEQRDVVPPGSDFCALSTVKLSG